MDQSVGSHIALVSSVQPVWHNTGLNGKGDPLQSEIRLTNGFLLRGKIRNCRNLAHSKTISRNELKGRNMFDPTLRQSIQRWENEGGLLHAAHRSLYFEIVARNKSYQSWNEIDRDAFGRTGGTNENPLITSQIASSSNGMKPAKRVVGKTA